MLYAVNACGTGDCDNFFRKVAQGTSSFFRGIGRFVRHQNRLLGANGGGQQVQANTVEHMLLGEGVELALHANQEIINQGLGKIIDAKIQLLSRQGTALALGAAAGGTAGPSLSILAGAGDAYYAVEQVAIENSIYFHTVDTSMPILPQLPDGVRTNVTNRLLDLSNDFLLGE